MKKVSGKITDFISTINPKGFFLLLFLVLSISGAGGSYYFYDKYQALLENPNLEAQKETEALILALGELMELPTDEVPTIAVISDKEKFQDQDFFKSVENGDVLFAYTIAMKAILYRPDTNKIIDVAPINLTGEDVTLSSEDVRVAYYNGTSTPGLALKAEETVKERFDNFQTVLMSKASNTDYEKTIVIDLSGQYSQEALELAELLDGTVAFMPEDEILPAADILVISGK